MTISTQKGSSSGVWRVQYHERCDNSAPYWATSTPLVRACRQGKLSLSIYLISLYRYLSL
jgi:hypothetical protein